MDTNLLIINLIISVTLAIIGYSVDGVYFATINFLAYWLGALLGLYLKRR